MYFSLHYNYSFSPPSPSAPPPRLPLPEPWRGLRDELSKKCEVENCVFVHVSGFIGGSTTKEGAVEMAVKALDFKEPDLARAVS